jgi:hypothetical protein
MRGLLPAWRARQMVGTAGITAGAPSTEVNHYIRRSFKTDCPPDLTGCMITVPG